MKKILVALLLSLLSYVAPAQSSYDDQMDAATLKAINSPVNGKANDGGRFPVLLNGFVNLLSTDGKSDIEINPTLYSLFGNDNNLQNIKHYRNAIWQRNTSVLVGITPDSKNQLRLDDGIFGAKFIAISNKVLKEKDYEAIASSTALKVLEVNKYVRSLPNGPALMHKYLTAHDTTNKLVNDKEASTVEIILAVAKHFNVNQSEAADLITGDFAIQDALARRLLTKSALNLAYNQVYDFQKGQSAKVGVSSDYSFFIGSWPFDLTGTITFSPDSTQANSRLVRTIYEIDFGKNITFKSIKWLEVKPAVSYVNTEGPLYSKEKHVDFAASITPQFKINKKFSFPVTIKYDPKGFLGFVAIQYSAK